MRHELSSSGDLYSTTQGFGTLGSYGSDISCIDPYDLYIYRQIKVISAWESLVLLHYIDLHGVMGAGTAVPVMVWRWVWEFWLLANIIIFGILNSTSKYICSDKHGR